MTQIAGTFPALYDNQRRKPKVTPLPLKKLLAPPPTPKKKAK